MRTFETLSDAASEIRRDVYKGPKVESTRVQGWEGLELAGRERFGYTYAIMDPNSIPTSPAGLVSFGMQNEFPLYVEHCIEMENWLVLELDQRLHPQVYLSSPPADALNPALAKAKEGDTYSYLYRERLAGMMKAMRATLLKNPDSRRAYWPMFQPLDALRASSPTRIPCTVGYEAMIRNVGGVEKLLWFYIERSCDFDNFWLSDVWFAHKLQEQLAQRLKVEMGALIHFVISFHSFFSEGTEIY